MKDEEQKVFREIPAEMLCEEGQQLWEAVSYRKPNTYDDYRRHLLECKTCQEGLELRREDLLRIRGDINGVLKIKEDKEQKK